MTQGMGYARRVVFVFILCNDHGLLVSMYARSVHSCKGTTIIKWTLQVSYSLLVKGAPIPNSLGLFWKLMGPCARDVISASDDSVSLVLLP